MFHHVMQQNLEDKEGQYFDNNILPSQNHQDMIRIIVDNKSKKGPEEFKFIVVVTQNKYQPCFFS